jgi:hypothetical protein
MSALKAEFHAAVRRLHGGDCRIAEPLRGPIADLLLQVSQDIRPGQLDADRIWRQEIALVRAINAASIDAAPVTATP